jgi:hypothetical protein
MVLYCVLFGLVCSLAPVTMSRRTSSPGAVARNIALARAKKSALEEVIAAKKQREASLKVSKQPELARDDVTSSSNAQKRKVTSPPERTNPKKYIYIATNSTLRRSPRKVPCVWSLCCIKSFFANAVLHPDRGKLPMKMD